MNEVEKKEKERWKRKEILILRDRLESGLAHLVVQLTILYKLRYAGTSTRCFLTFRYFLLQSSLLYLYIL